MRIGVDVILVDVPELSEYEMLFGKGKRKKQNKNTDTPLWQQEVQAYRDETSSDTIIMLNREDYREV